MKLIIEREATFENNSNIKIKVTQKISRALWKTMKQDMLNSRLPVLFDGELPT